MRPTGCVLGSRVIMAACSVAAVLLGANSAVGQGADATVTTLAGSPSGTTTNSYAGHRDGAAIGEVVNGVGNVAQFNQPVALAADPAGVRLFVADMANDALRLFDLEQSSVETVAIYPAGSAPVDVRVDSATNIFVLTQGDGFIRRYDKNTNLLGAVNFAAPLTTPTAMALDADSDIYVVEMGGALKKVKLSDGSVSTIAVTGGALSSPQGIEVLDNGSVVISDTGNHVLRYLTQAGTITNTVGMVGVTNRTLGGAMVARFSSPTRIAKAGGNIAVVADTQNHRMVTVTLGGEVDLLYGISPATWLEFESLYPGLAFELHPGWEDGMGNLASSRVPSGVAVLGSGDVLTSELYYNIIRQTTGTGLRGPAGSISSGGGGDGGDSLPNPPEISISPTSGYFPMGVDVQVASSSDTVYYRTDGQTATTNDNRVTMSGGVGTIPWFEPLRDLASLRISAFTFSGTNVISTNVTGIASSLNEIGVPTDIQAGIGSTVVVPLVVNLNTNDTLKSLQFRVAVTPDSGNVPFSPIAPGDLDFVPTSTNDFIRLAGPVENDGATLNYVVSEDFNATDSSRLLSVSTLGPTNFNLTGFAAVAVLAVKIPSTAVAGHSFTVSILNPSGTSDGLQDDVAIAPMATRTITIANIPYVVGDSAPGRWYNAGQFGNGDLLNSDVNNVFLASLGIRVPYTFTDAFNAMDAYPDEALGGSPDGDGAITIADWALVSARSLRADGNNFERSWSTGGVRVNNTTTLPLSPDLGLPASLPGDVWSADVQISAGDVDRAKPGDIATVPVTVRINSGVTVQALGFRAAVISEGSAPDSAEFVAWNPVGLGAGIMAPQNDYINEVGPGETGSRSVGRNELPIGWLQANLTGTALIGEVKFRVPATASAGDSYRIRFFLAGGVTDSGISLFESYSGRVRVLEDNPEEVAVSDEWLKSFFGAVDRALIETDMDSDGDGIPNWKEFIAGTNPKDALSKLQFVASKLAMTEGVGDRLEWVTAPGKTYIIEGSDNIVNGPWTVIDTVTGDGKAQEIIADNLGELRFYRIRLAP